ncbi:hypothetical protein B0H14DRAFT_2596740 [Mycena olivaceomarginata]|nr:hypothetical protein B0H14DRAFT_2596740 [Mycena olivaceomarginata]
MPKAPPLANCLASAMTKDHVSATRLWPVLRFLLVALRSDSTSTLNMKGVRAGCAASNLEKVAHEGKNALFDSGPGRDVDQAEASQFMYGFKFVFNRSQAPAARDPALGSFLGKLCMEGVGETPVRFGVRSSSENESPFYHSLGFSLVFNVQCLCAYGFNLKRNLDRLLGF